MQMEYKLISGIKRGFIATREPEVVEGELRITFTDAPENATAIFENKNGDSVYRLLSEGNCAVPESFLLKGNIKVTVVVLNGKPDAPKYICEDIYARVVNGAVVVCPNGINITAQIIELFAEIEKTNGAMRVLEERQTALDAKLIKLLEGYDAI